MPVHTPRTDGTAGSLSIPSIPLKQTLPQLKVSVLAPQATSGRLVLGPVAQRLSPARRICSLPLLRAQRECTVRACEANVCCSSCHNTDAHASAYTCRAHAPNDVPQWDARQDEVDHSERLRKLEEELRQMEADREKEVSSLQLESSKGALPTAVLDSDDEEDALRSRTRSLHFARRNGGSRAGQGWGLSRAHSLSSPSPSSLSHLRARAHTHTHTHTHTHSLVARSTWCSMHADAHSALFL